MCLTCDVKVAGTGACKAVLNICQASSAPRFEESRVVGVHLSIDRRVSNWKSSRSFVVGSRRNIWKNYDAKYPNISVQLLSQFLTNFAYIYVSLYVIYFVYVEKLILYCIRFFFFFY